MNPAETQPGNTGQATDPAPGAEPLIPKHRLDEVAAELRRVREEMAMKDNLYLQDRQRTIQAAQPRQTEAELTPEDTGLDPQTHQAVVKTARVLAGRMIQQERVNFEQQIGILANRTEKAELLATHGADKAKLIPEIQKRQQQHYQATGSFLPAEVALKLIQADEYESRIKALEARLAGAPSQPAQAPQVQTQPQTYSATFSAPSAAGTRTIPGGGGAIGTPGAAKSFSELSWEEMEARLEEQFKAGARA